jgi:threonine/homoserine/homoserine lactone efflux protein
VAVQSLTYLGVAYLLYLAWATWKDTGAPTVEDDAAPRSARRVIASGILINILNPIYGVFAAVARQHVISRPRFVTGMRSSSRSRSSLGARLAAESR